MCQLYRHTFGPYIPTAALQVGVLSFSEQLSQRLNVEKLHFSGSLLLCRSGLHV